MILTLKKRAEKQQNVRRPIWGHLLCPAENMM